MMKWLGGIMVQTIAAGASLVARGAKIPGLLLTAAVEQYILDRISRFHTNLDSTLAV